MIASDFLTQPKHNPDRQLNYLELDPDAGLQHQQQTLGPKEYKLLARGGQHNHRWVESANQSDFGDQHLNECDQPELHDQRLFGLSAQLSADDNHHSAELDFGVYAPGLPN